MTSSKTLGGREEGRKGVLLRKQKIRVEKVGMIRCERFRCLSGVTSYMLGGT
jgi:hypothetical protein